MEKSLHGKTNGKFLHGKTNGNSEKNLLRKSMEKVEFIPFDRKILTQKVT